MFAKIMKVFVVLLIVGSTAACSGEPLNTREKGALWGTALGAGGGAIIGAATGSPGTGALIGGATGLVGGALIGDYMMGQERRSYRHARLVRRHRSHYARRHLEYEQAVE